MYITLTTNSMVKLIISIKHETTDRPAQVRAASKKYHAKNKAVINAKKRNSALITCACGSVYKYRNRAPHFKTFKHQLYVDV